MIIVCSKCNSRYQLKDDAQGKVRCKKCQELIDIAGAVITPAASAEMKTVVPPKTEQKTIITASASQKTVVSPAAQQAQKTVVTPKKPASQPAGDDPLVGTTLGGYQILKKLGQGGMGAVYEARQVSLDRSVALKVLPGALAANHDFILRFTREALSVAKLNHNNIVQIYDVGKEDGTYFFAMEFVRGVTLQRMIEKEGPMDPVAAAGYCIQAARGMDYAHRKSIVHRDIKPDNIMINEEGVAKVADLGLAKDVQEQDSGVTMAGIGMGTPYYMAPEQASDAKSVDHRADIYSLGCTLYQLATGRIPYDGKSAYEIITKHVNEPITMPHLVRKDVPEELSDIIAKMMSKKKEERYGSMAEVVAALEGYLGVDSSRAGFQPTETQINAVRAQAKSIAEIRKSPVRRGAIFGLFGLTALVGAIGLLTGKLPLLAGAIEFAVVAPLVYFIAAGMARKTYLYRRVRKVLFSNRLTDWILLVIMGVVVVALVLMFGLIGTSIAAVAVGFGIAMAYYFGISRPSAQKQDAILEDTRKTLREMRRKGIPDEELALFVLEYGDAQGEHVCEELFGYEATALARSRRAEEKRKAGFVERFRARMVKRMDAIEAKRQDRRMPAKLPPAEVEAAQKAAASAAKTVVSVTAPTMPAIQKGAAAAAAAKAASSVQVETAAAEEFLNNLEKGRSGGGGAGFSAKELIRFIFGPRGRIAVGAILVLLAALSHRGIAMGENELLRSYSFGLFSVGIVLTGFVRSRLFMIMIGLTCILTGPLVWWGSGLHALVNQPILEFAKEHNFMQAVVNWTQSKIGADAVKNITVPFAAGIAAMLVGFVGQFIWDY